MHSRPVVLVLTLSTKNVVILPKVKVGMSGTPFCSAFDTYSMPQVGNYVTGATTRIHQCPEVLKVEGRQFENGRIASPRFPAQRALACSIRFVSQSHIKHLLGYLVERKIESGEIAFDQEGREIWFSNLN
jgi:hypothetical protein